MKGLALGCSHTTGTGVSAAECYVSLLSAHYECNIHNTAQAGGNAVECVQRLVEYLRLDIPDFIIAQWPNPIRRTTWISNKARLENIHNSSAIFLSLLEEGIDNFMQPWLQCIIIVDTLCKLARIPVVHILLEDIDPIYIKILDDYNITLHQDLKTPSQTWLFDNAGSDGLHHSARCHAQWAKRLIGLIDEHTT